MNYEGRHITGREHEPEGDLPTEIARFLSQLDAEAEKVGFQLEETDFVRIGPDETMKLYGRFEMIMSALAVALGVSVAHQATQSLFQAGPEQADAVRIMTRLGLAAVGGGGAALMFAGLRRLEVGYKRLQGYIRIKELKGLKG